MFQELRHFRLPQDKFEKLSFLAIAGLLLASIALILLSSSETLRVKSVQINGGSSAAEIQNQKLQVHFNRPILKETAQVGISPQVNYSMSWQGNDLIVTFNENLQSDTSYTLAIGADTQDVYHTALGRQFQYDFHTKTLKLYFLQKDNSGQETAISSANPDLTNVQEVFKAPYITHFAVNRQYVAAITAQPSQTENEVTIKALKDGSVRYISLDKKRVNKVIFSPTNPQEMALIVQNLTQMQGVLIPDAGSKIRIYNLNDLTFKEVNPKNTATEVVDIFYAATGQTILFKSADANFYIADLNNPDNLVILSKHLASSGFNRQSDKILFIDFDPLQTYSSIPYLSLFNSDKSSTSINANDNYVLDPAFLNNEARLVYAEKVKDLEGTKGIFGLKLINYAGKSVRLYNDPADRSIELPRPSADDRYVAAERYEQKDMLDYSNQRDFQFQTKPGNATIIVIDLFTGLIADKGISGVDAVWQQ